MDIVQTYTRNKMKTHPTCVNLNAGDTVNVFVKVREGEKERVQAYMGVVIKVQGEGPNRNFTVRKISDGVGVERTFPMASPLIDRVEIISKGKVRRSKLYFLRGLSGKAARLQSELVIATSTAPEATAKEAAPKALVSECQRKLILLPLIGNPCLGGP